MNNNIIIRRFNKDVDFKINKFIEYMAEDSNNYKYYKNISDEDFLILSIGGKDTLLIIKEEINTNKINEVDILFLDNSVDYRLLNGLFDDKTRSAIYSDIAENNIVFAKEYFNLNYSKDGCFYNPIKAKELSDSFKFIKNKGKTKNLKDKFINKGHHINVTEHGNILSIDCERII